MRRQSQPTSRQLPRQQQRFFNCGCCKPFLSCDHCYQSAPTLRGWTVSVSGLISVPFSSDDLHPGDCDPNPPRTCTYDVSGAEGTYRLTSGVTGPGASCAWNDVRYPAITDHCVGCGLADGNAIFSVTATLSWGTSFPGSVSYPWQASLASGSSVANYRAADSDCSGAITLSKYAESIGTVGVTFPASLTFSPLL